jgi:hypothetical protein
MVLDRLRASSYNAGKAELVGSAVLRRAAGLSNFPIDLAGTFALFLRPFHPALCVMECSEPVADRGELESILMSAHDARFGAGRTNLVLDLA